MGQLTSSKDQLANTTTKLAEVNSDMEGLRSKMRNEMAEITQHEVRLEQARNETAATVQEAKVNAQAVFEAECVAKWGALVSEYQAKETAYKQRIAALRSPQPSSATMSELDDVMSALLK